MDDDKNAHAAILIARYVLVLAYSRKSTNEYYSTMDPSDWRPWNR